MTSDSASTPPRSSAVRATNVPVPSQPDWSIKVSFRMLTGVSNDRPGNVGNGRPWAVAATTAVTATTPTATG